MLGIRAACVCVLHLVLSLGVMQAGVASDFVTDLSMEGAPFAYAVNACTYACCCTLPGSRLLFGAVKDTIDCLRHEQPSASISFACRAVLAAWLICGASCTTAAAVLLLVSMWQCEVF